MFYLDETDTYCWVMIHKAACRSCHHGQGTQPQAQGIASRWHGPYPTYEAAHASGLSLHERVYACQRCVPSACSPRGRTAATPEQERSDFL
jgi:cytochrome c